jgi:hypothetical protein
MDFNAEVREMGVRSSYIERQWDGERYRAERIDDVDLAHDMALAMDAHMEDVVAFNSLHQQLSQEPDATFRRAGQKAVIFNKLASAQKAENDKGNDSVMGYSSAPTVEDYVKGQNQAYERTKTGKPYGKVDAKRITNGYVDTLVISAVKRHQRIADKAGELVFFKQRERENIAVYEQHLSKKDQEVFARIEPREEDPHHKEWFEGDEEALALDRRSTELWDIFRKKLVVQAVAKTFGRTSLRGFSREDMVALAKIANEESYTIKA